MRQRAGGLRLVPPQERAQLGRDDQEERERPILVVRDVSWSQGNEVSGDLVFRV